MISIQYVIYSLVNQFLATTSVCVRVLQGREGEKGMVEDESCV